MAVSVTNLTAAVNTTGASSFNTASVSPTANNLILLSVSARRADSTQPVAPTVTGNGLTWVKIAEIYFDTDSSSRKTLFLFRALGSSPSSGAITMDYGSQTINQTTWQVNQASGIDTSGTNGSGAVVQSATNKDEVSGGGTLTVTLAAFASTDNATFGAFACDTVGAGPTVGSGFTMVGSNDDQSNTVTESGSEWKATNDTGVDMTFASAAGAKMGGIAIEIKAAAAAGGTNKFFRQQMGIGTM